MIPSGNVMFVVQMVIRTDLSLIIEDFGNALKMKGSFITCVLEFEDMA